MPIILIADIISAITLICLGGLLINMASKEDEDNPSTLWLFVFGETMCAFIATFVITTVIIIYGT